MRNLLQATGPAFLLLCGLAGAPAAAADADLKITVTNGNDTAGDVKVQVRPAGQHDGDVVAYGGSGDDLTMPAGTYDVEVTYTDGAAQKTVWFDGLAVSGRVEKTVDMGLPVAALTVVVTNGGADVGGNGTFEIRPAGQHGADVIAYAASGNTVRLAAGTYDIDARFRDGDVEKIVWLDGVALSGAVTRTIEVGAPVADVTWRIINHGQEVAADAIYQIRPNHAGDVVAWGNSGRKVRIPAGTYDVEVTYAKGLIKKTVWSDRQNLAGRIEKSTELDLDTAEATVSATLNGADVGARARIGIAPAGQQEEIGAIRGGETAELEAGRYALTATMPGAEGMLRDAAIAGHAHLIVAMKALRTAELKPGGPPPRECTIEVYGVNFDFNKSTLRPDSLPVLAAVLRPTTTCGSRRRGLRR